MDRGLAQSMTSFITVLSVVTSVTRLPSLLVSFAGIRLRAGSNYLISYIITSYFRLNFLTYIVLILFLHKQVRVKLIKALKKLIKRKNPTKIVPANTSTT